MAKESKHVVNFKTRHAEPGEEIVATAEGYIGKAMGSGKDAQQNGCMIVTQQRAVFYRKGMLGEVLETMPLKSITSVERKSILGHRVLRLHTSHDHLEFKTFDKQGEAALAIAINAGRESQSPAPDSSAVPLPLTLDPAERLTKLASLKEAGLLTEEEFATKRAELIAQL
ncbi:MAG TPA: hypothetical protein ENH72_09685 [Pseudomonas sabulinigri]|uniref:YokE-like PH domain-containing protein n=1 Tax=marine sediment metagenome TaxID=412755 RepID=A0A0F9VVN5_9ZZZZ|nr:hypothetical protein [Halopseudomonas sabulinigri]HEC50822.1 hypothetical protein [Halopseudomonas sabulinigri]